MARCEDFPCCGHDICPDYDDCGNQLNMKCTCGATVPLGSRSSLCNACLNAETDEEIYNRDYEFDGDKEFDDLEHIEGDYESE